MTYIEIHMGVAMPYHQSNLDQKVVPDFRMNLTFLHRIRIATNISNEVHPEITHPTLLHEIKTSFTFSSVCTYTNYQRSVQFFHSVDLNRR